MKIYCSRQKYTLDWFIGKPYWVLCYINCSPYQSEYAVKFLDKTNGVYKCNLIHHNNIGLNDNQYYYIQDDIKEQDLQLIEPVDMYLDSEHSNWVARVDEQDTDTDTDNTDDDDDWIF